MKAPKIEEFHIGYEYYQLEHDGERYLGGGKVWKRKVYGFDSPRLYKMQKLIESGEIRKVEDNQ